MARGETETAWIHLDNSRWYGFLSCAYVCFLLGWFTRHPISFQRFIPPNMCTYLISIFTIWSPSPSRLWQPHLILMKKKMCALNSPPGPAVPVTPRWQCLLFQDRCRTCWEMACQASADGYYTVRGHYLWLGRPHQRPPSASPWSLRGQDRRKGHGHSGDGNRQSPCSPPGQWHWSDMPVTFQIKRGEHVSSSVMF